MKLKKSGKDNELTVLFISALIGVAADQITVGILKIVLTGISGLGFIIFSFMWIKNR
jgi:hypothetical protein